MSFLHLSRPSSLHEHRNVSGATSKYNRQLLLLLGCIGGILAPGGTVSLDGGGVVSPISFFAPETTEPRIKEIAETIRDLVRRYKYLGVTVEDEMVKILRFLKAFDEAQATKLAQATAYFLNMNVCTAKPLESLFNDALTRPGSFALSAVES